MKNIYSVCELNLLFIAKCDEYLHNSTVASQSHCKYFYPFPFSNCFFIAHINYVKKVIIVFSIVMLKDEGQQK